jgi:predicted  nucleic acid-binding Zn-ribbon protein
MPPDRASEAETVQCTDCGAVVSLKAVRQNQGLCPICGMRQFVDVKMAEKERKHQQWLARER